MQACRERPDCRRSHALELHGRSRPSPQRAAIAPKRECIRRRPERDVLARCRPSPGGARQLVTRRHETPCLICPKRAHGLTGRCAAVQLRGTGLGGRSRTPGLPPESAINSSGNMRAPAKSTGAASTTLRKRSGQRMEGAALIVQTEHAVMVVGIGIRDGRFGSRVPVGSDRRRFIHIQRVVADQRNNPRHLRNHEERHQAGAEAADGSYAGHGPELLPRHSRRRPARPAAANMPQC